MRWLWLVLLSGCDACEEAPIEPDQPSEDSGAPFDEPGEHYNTSAQTCESCHALQVAEWRGSIMHYAAQSPVFNAFELTMRELSGGAVAADGSSPNFCVRCHSPIADYNQEVPGFAEAEGRLAREFFSEPADEGLTCTWCHSITGPDEAGSLLQDGVANLALEYAPSAAMYGPIEDPRPSSYHAESRAAPFFTEPTLCGSCHDVRPLRDDRVTGEVSHEGVPFQRLENLFSEWQASDYGVPGQETTCQDCHMSLFPITEPGCYPQGPVAAVYYEDQVVALGAEDRRHALHAFTAVSDFPTTSPDEVRRYVAAPTEACGEYAGQTVEFPLGQQQRREQLLRAAAGLEIAAGTDAVLEPGADLLRVDVAVTNQQTGHNLPAGFSQERQVWIELIVSDEAGVLYQSGVLTDRAHPETGETVPDGRLDDEDLEGVLFEFHSAEDILHFTPTAVAGPDVDQRPKGINLGLVNFQNRFIVCENDDCSGFVACRDGACTPEAAASWSLTLSPLLTDHMDNGQSIPPLETRTARYDIPLPERAIVGDITVSARLRYRAFPPEFLRFLVQRMALVGHDGLLSEDTVDRNTIVEMASDTATVTVRR